MGERETGAATPPASEPATAPAASEGRSSEDTASPTPPLAHSPPLRTRRESAFVAHSEVRVRYVETDQMGFAHHSNYFAWFEIGRTDFIRALGTSYAQLERDGLLLAIAEAQVRYLAAARYDDLLVVHTSLERVQSRSVTFAYEVERVEPGPRVRVAASTMKLIALDANGSPRTIPPDFRRLLEEVVAPSLA